MIRLTDLRGKQVRTLDGKRLGKVHDVHCKDGAVTALMIGPGSVIEELTAKRHGRRIAWECVRKIEPDRIVVTPHPPKRRKN